MRGSRERRRVTSWLVQQGVVLPAALIPVKIGDHQRERAEFTQRLRERIQRLKNDPVTRDDFLKEMKRFLPAATGWDGWR